MEYTTLLFDVRDNVAHITFNRPDPVNLIDNEMLKELMHAVLRCGEDPDVRAVLISGAGRMFCGGGDLKVLSTQGNQLPLYIKEGMTYCLGAISGLTRMDAPTVAAVHGAVAGGAMGIVMACDIVIAAETTQFTMAYTRAGLTPDGATSYFLPRIVGLNRSLELMLTNRILSAQEALQWGLVARVVPDNELIEQARAIALQLAVGPTRAYGVSKRLLRSSWAETLETQIENESQAIANIVRTADTREGMKAFLEKRTPRYKGE